MSDRTPVHSRTITQWLVTAALILATAAVIFQVRQQQPYEAPNFVVDAGRDPDDPASDIITCERTLPDRPVTTEVETLDALGRVDSGEVINCPDLFDGRVVVYIGEVIGDVLHREDGAWVLMNDDEYALEVGPLDSHGEFAGYNSGLSVWLEGDLADLVEQPGGPRWRGDVLRVRGVIRRADPDDGGGLTLRAFSGRVIAPAVELERPLNRPQAIVAGVLGTIALATVAYGRITSRPR